MGTPHDSLFRDTFGKAEHAAALLRALLPPVLASAIDWNSLQPEPEPQIDERLQNQQTDQLFKMRVGGRPAFLYVVFEHTVRPSRWTALRVLSYVVGIWKDLRRRQPQPRLLPPIVPVVVSLGRRRWRASTDLVSLLDIDGLSAAQRTALLTAMPQFRLTPHDFAAKTPSEVRAMGLSLLGLCTIAAQQFVAPVGHDDDAVVRAIVDWADVARQVVVAPNGQEAFAAISSYILKVTKLGRRRLSIVFDQHIGGPSMKKFESTYDRITRESRAEGKAEGKAEGRAEGAAALLQQLLRRRFGAIPKATAARLAKASSADINRWAERVLDAATLADVFAD